jgi:hypothetical protein
MPPQPCDPKRLDREDQTAEVEQAADVRTGVAGGRYAGAFWWFRDNPPGCLTFRVSSIKLPTGEPRTAAAPSSAVTIGEKGGR